MRPVTSLGLLALTLLVAVTGVWYLARGAADKRALEGDTGRGRTGVRGWLAGGPNRAVRRTQWGRRLERRLLAANLPGVLPAEAVVVVAVVVVAVTVAASTLVSSLVAVIIAVAAVLLLRQWLVWREDQQRVAFVGQMPELARVLSNATSAGLSIRTAIEMAGEELAEPARTELRRCARSMAVGTPLEEALLQMEQRLPGRELSVLVGTLVISSRSGGSLITALRDIAATLEDRKELKREVRTLLTQATYTGYLVVALGVGLLFMLNTISPGLLKTVTSTPIGLLALGFAVCSFGIGMLLIRRMTRIET
ncbi:type II secretion system F family protein [Angustibacter aerolatus]